MSLYVVVVVGMYIMYVFVCVWGEIPKCIKKYNKSDHKGGERIQRVWTAKKMRYDVLVQQYSKKMRCACFIKTKIKKERPKHTKNNNTNNTTTTTTNNIHVHVPYCILRSYQSHR